MRSWSGLLAHTQTASVVSAWCQYRLTFFRLLVLEQVDQDAAPGAVEYVLPLRWPTGHQASSEVQDPSVEATNPCHKGSCSGGPSQGQGPSWGEERSASASVQQCEARGCKRYIVFTVSHRIHAGFVEEMRFAAMKLHTREQAPKEGSRPETENPTPKVCQVLCPPCLLLQASGCCFQTGSLCTGFHTHPRGLPPIPGRVQKGL